MYFAPLLVILQDEALLSAPIPPGRVLVHIDVFNKGVVGSKCTVKSSSSYLMSSFSFLSWLVRFSMAAYPKEYCVERATRRTTVVKNGSERGTTWHEQRTRSCVCQFVWPLHGMQATQGQLEKCRFLAVFQKSSILTCA